VVLDQQVNNIAKNLLLDHTCYNCYYYKNDFTSAYTCYPTKSCHSYPRARKEYNVLPADDEFRKFKLNGVVVSEQNTCEYWESNE